MLRDAIGYGLSVMAVAFVLTICTGHPAWILVAIIVFGAITKLGKALDSRGR